MFQVSDCFDLAVTRQALLAVQRDLPRKSAFPCVGPNPFDRKVALTDAFGRFAVRLDDGDWTVNVTMPSGRVYSVSQIRVSNGQITDPQGNRVPSLEITR